MQPRVVILTKLPGAMPVKTRLAAQLGAVEAERAYERMLACTLELALALDPAPMLAFSPPDGDPHARLRLPPRVRPVPVEGGDGAICLERALDHAADGRPLVALGGDAPDLPAALVRSAIERLADVDVAFVPTGDGGFSCMVTRGPVAGLAEGLQFGDGNALEQLERFLASRGLQTARTAPWPDVDTPAQYAAWRSRRAAVEAAERSPR